MNTTSNLYKELTNTELVAIVNEYSGANQRFEYRLLSGGLFNTTYLLTFLSCKIVLRVGPINCHLLLPFEHNLMNGEKYVYDLCKQSNIPTSSVLFCDTSKNIIDRDYMIVNYIPSEALSEIKVNEQINYSLYYQSGEYASKIHEITGTKFGRVSNLVLGKGFYKWSDYLKSEIFEWQDKVSKIGIYTGNELEKINNIFVEYTDLLDEIKIPKLVHADLWAGNILVNNIDGNYKVVAIIDADRAVFGDTDFEFASGWMINEAFIKGYGVELNNDNEFSTRRKIYALVYNLLDSYLCLAQYNSKEKSDLNRNSAISILDELV